MPTELDLRQAQFAEIHAVIERAIPTVVQMESLAEKWVWSMCSPEQFQAKIEEIQIGSENLNGQAFDRANEERTAEHAVQDGLDKLHAMTVKGIEVARVAWADMPELKALVGPLRAGGQAVAEIIAEGEAWEAAWEEADPAWVAMPGVTLPILSAQLGAVREAQRVLRQRTAKRRRAEARLALAVRAVDQLSKDWYAVATVVFGVGTPEGDQIRRLVPTTYQPRYAAAAKRKRKEKREAAKAAAEQASAGVGEGEAPAG